MFKPIHKAGEIGRYQIPGLGILLGGAGVVEPPTLLCATTFASGLQYR